MAAELREAAWGRSAINMGGFCPQGRQQRLRRTGRVPHVELALSGDHDERSFRPGVNSDAGARQGTRTPRLPTLCRPADRTLTSFVKQVKRRP